jgi:hypothetical protein
MANVDEIKRVDAIKGFSKRSRFGKVSDKDVYIIPEQATRFRFIACQNTWANSTLQ